MNSESALFCEVCKLKPELISFSHSKYPYRSDYGKVWKCLSCNAFVGCHKGTENPLGYLANKEMRELRKMAHDLFDPIWKSKEMSRAAAYKRMAVVLGIPKEKAHISQLTIDQLKKLIRSLQKRNELFNKS